MVLFSLLLPVSLNVFIIDLTHVAAQPQNYLFHPQLFPGCFGLFAVLTCDVVDISLKSKKFLKVY